MLWLQLLLDESCADDAAANANELRRLLVCACMQAWMRACAQACKCAWQNDLEAMAVVPIDDDTVQSDGNADGLCAPVPTHTRTHAPMHRCGWRSDTGQC